MEELGIDNPPCIHITQFLHSRWRRYNFAPFLFLYKKKLRAAHVVYTRSVLVSMALGKEGISHNLEIHNSNELIERKYLETLVSYLDKGIIGHVFPISNAVSGFLLEKGADPGKIQVLPSGVKIELFESITPFDPLRLKDPRILYMGRISRSRGLGIFEALAEKDLAKITLVGEIEDRPSPNCNLNHIPFVPHREVPDYYSKADMVLLPYQLTLEHAASISPMKLFEAMASGRPIIASNIPPIKEILRHGENAILVEPSNPQDWVDAVLMLKNDPSLAVKLAARAKEQALEYSWESRAQKIVTALGIQA